MLSSLTFAMCVVVSKAAFNAGAEGLSFSLASLVFSVLFFLPYYALVRPARLTRRDYAELAVVGLVGSGISNALLYVGVSLTTASNASLLSQVVTVFSVAFAFILLGERISRRQALAGAVMLAGALLVAGQGASLSAHLGDLLILGMAVTLGLTGSLAKRVMSRHNSGTVAFWRSAFGVPFLLVAAMAFSPAPLAGFSWYAVLNGLLATVTIGMLYYGFDRIGVSLSSILSLAGPLFGVSLALVLLGESLSAPQLAGGALILSGAFIMVWRKRWKWS